MNGFTESNPNPDSDSANRLYAVTVTCAISDQLNYADVVSSVRKFDVLAFLQPRTATNAPP